MSILKSIFKPSHLKWILRAESFGLKLKYTFCFVDLTVSVDFVYHIVNFIFSGVFPQRPHHCDQVFCCNCTVTIFVEDRECFFHFCKERITVGWSKLLLKLTCFVLCAAHEQFHNYINIFFLSEKLTFDLIIREFHRLEFNERKRNMLIKP